MEAEDIMTTRIKLRRDTAANWFDANPILSAGEPGLETDTKQVKYGDGITTWRDLSYSNSHIKSMDPVNITTQDPATWVNMVGKPRNACVATALAYDSQGSLVVVTTSYGGATGYDAPFMNVSKFDEDGNTLWSSDIPGNITSFSGGVAVDLDDNVYVAILVGEDGNSYGTVIKIDGMTGNSIWTESFDNDQYNTPNGLDVGPDNMPVLVGTTSTGGNPPRAYAIKFNSQSGAILHAKIWNSDYENDANGLAVDQNNNVYITGVSSDPATETYVLVVQKLNPNLDPIWTKKIPSVKSSRGSTIYDNGGAGIAVDASGNVFVTGYYTDSANISSEPITQVVVMKLDSNGNVVWSRDIRGNCGSAGTSITVGDDGLVYLGAYTSRGIYTQTSAGYQDFVQQLLMACYQPDTGKVLWQRTMDPLDFGLSSPGLINNAPAQYNTGGAIAVHGSRLAVCGFIVPIGKNGYNNLYYGDVKAWVLQVPSNGELVDISGWRLNEGRIPGRMQSYKSVDFSGFSTINGFEWGPGSDVSYTGSSVLEVTTLLQDSNTWKFGTNGDLTLPPDGDLDIGKRTVGWVNLQGHKINYDHNVEFQGICVDTVGNSYAFGIDQGGAIPYFVKYNLDGGLEYQKQLWYDGNNHVIGNIEGGVYDERHDRVVMIVTDYPNNDSFVVTVNAVTGDVYSTTKFQLGQSTFNMYDVDVLDNGTPVVVGTTYGGAKTYALHPIDGGTNDGNGYSYMDVPVTDFGSDQPPHFNEGSYWYLTGSDVTGEQYTYAINQYDPLTATNVPGVGATITVTVSGGAYTAVAVVAGGTGYKVNDIITIPGTNLGGATPDNSLLVNVDTVDAGVITGVSIVSGTATGADAVYTAQPGVTGTGYGATWYVYKFDDSGPAYTLGFNNGGSGYKVNDILKILGSQTGGVDGTNDITITVNGVDGGGAITGISSTGTISLATVRLLFDLAVDFGNTTNDRAWQLGYYQNNDAVLWTPDWYNIFGSDHSDYGYSVAVNKMSGDIFVTGSSEHPDFFSGGSPTVWVSKFNSSGAMQWTVNLNDGYAPTDNSHICVDSIGDVIVCLSNYGRNQELYKLRGTDGSALWRANTDAENVFDIYDGSVAVDSDDNIIITGEDDWNQWVITKLDTSGALQWQNRLRTVNWFGQHYENNGTRWTAVYGDHVFTGGTTDAISGSNQDYNGFVAKLPLTGEGTDGIDEFVYEEVQIPFANTSNPTIHGAWTPFTVHSHVGITTTSVSMISLPEQGYETIQYPMLSATGGGIVFGDGTRQETSASLLKQRLVGYYNSGANYQNSYKIRANDAGRHILLTYNQDVWLPSYHDVQFPVGTVITIINWSGNTRKVYYESGDYGWANGNRTTYLGISGGNADYFNSFLVIPSYNGGNIVTLIKVRDEKMSDYTDTGDGSVTSYWIASGTNLSFND